MDDASEDDTPRVLRSFADPRIRVLRHEKPGGGAAARNDAIACAAGEFVAFLDDDDEWLPEKLEAQVGLLRAADPGVGVVYSSYSVVDRESGRILGRKVAQARGDLSKALLARNVVGAISACSCVEVASRTPERSTRRFLRFRTTTSGSASPESPGSTSSIAICSGTTSTAERSGPIWMASPAASR